MAGLLAGRPLFAVLDGDASLRRRPMGRVVEPLRAMGAAFAGPPRRHAPAAGRNGPRPPLPHRLPDPVPSAQVKSAILLAALPADGETRVTEAVATRDHTERMLRARAASAVREETADDGAHTVVRWPARPASRPSRRPFPPIRRAPRSGWWPASIHPDAELRLEGVSTNPTRRAIIDILRRMGASIEEIAVEGPGGPDGEPLADLVVRSSELRGIDLSPAEVAAAIDEIPVLALAAAAAIGHDTHQGSLGAPAQGVRPRRGDRGRPHGARARTSASRATTSRSAADGA